MIIFGYEVSTWRIVFLSVLLCITAWHMFAPSAIEGFISGNKGFDKFVGCPAIQNTIDKHTKLLEGFTAKDAVVSAEHAKDILEVFTKSFDEHDCETYLKNQRRRRRQNSGAHVFLRFETRVSLE
jgi:hypothetical protein